MPHVDEFFAPATLAAAGLAVAIALQPMPGHPTPDAPAPAADVVASTRIESPVQLPSIEVVATRRDALASRPRPERSLRKAA
ncbi:MAG TPA: hypothetical protein PLM09_01520 [Casimicrobiaceae bacterium]|nr:hypothetical protein [Casimicrobiaceae bacterium]